MWQLGLDVFDDPTALVAGFAAVIVVGFVCGYAVRARISARRRGGRGEAFRTRRCEFSADERKLGAVRRKG